MTLLNNNFYPRNQANLLPKRAWGLSGIFNTSRTTLTILSLTILTACSQPDQSSMQKEKVGVSKISSSADNSYGRKATFSYPDFAGKFNVASHSVVLSDQSRLEPFDSDSIENRKLQIRFYYPTKISSNSTREQDRLPVISQNAWDYLVGPHQVAGKMLRFDNYQNARWNIALGAEVDPVQPSYPVLIFSHGYGFSAESYSALSAELASKGYIVVSINHTYGANPSDFGNNDLVWAKPLPSDSTGAYLPVWSDDQMFVIDQLSLINGDPDSLFFNKLDLSNLGVFGHSYGGAASYYTASREPRIKAVIDIDGTIFDFEDRYIDQPFAFILSKNHQPKFNFKLVANDAYQIRFQLFEHISFTDHILWWQWDHDELDLGLGKVDAHRAVELTAKITSQFFDKYLNNQSADWLDNQSRKSEEIEILSYQL
jgi:pimeloyl-ACP methyl ester carboxylesterase